VKEGELTGFVFVIAGILAELRQTTFEGQKENHLAGVTQKACYQSQTRLTA
jgi:hypothetical protein